MSYYNLFEVDIIQTSQLYLGGGINQPNPSSGLVLYSDGLGGTFWSTVSGGVFSPQSLTSTVDGLGNAGYASTTYVTGQISSFSTALGTIGSGNLTTSNLVSTVIGLGTSGYISSQQLQSTVVGLNTYISSFIDVPELTSTLVGLGTYGYFSTIGIYSTVTGLYNFIQDDIGSTIVGLGTAGFISTIGLDAKLASTTAGLGTAGYASTIAVQQLSNYTKNILQDFSTGLSTVALFTSNTSNYSKGILQDFSTGISTVALFTSNTSNYSKGILQDFSTGISTVALFTSNTSNYYSNLLALNLSTSLQSTAIGLGTLGYISTAQLLSTVLGLNTYISSFIDTTELTSTLIGLGTFGYFSTIGIYSTVTGLYNFIQDDIGSTIVGLGTAGFVSTIGLDAKLASTTNGLGTAGYISSQQLQSTTLGLQQYISTQVSIPANTTGTVLYLNYSTIVSPYRGLGISPTTAPSTNLLTNLTASTSNINVSQFQSYFEVPTFIPPGIWDINLFAQSSKTTGIFVYASLFTRTQSGTETLVASSSNNPTIIDNLTDILYDIPFVVPYTYISTNTTIVLKLFANNTDPSPQTLNTFYEGATYSHIHTTFGTLLPNDVLNSTVMGLGTAGYVSTIAFQQLSNYTRNILQDWSTSISTVALFTSNTSNFSRNILQNTSTWISTVALFTSNTSNYSQNLLQNTSTWISTVALFTSNTSNFSRNILQDFSTGNSTVATFTSNTSNYYSNLLLLNVSTAIQSTVIGLGTLGYVSTTQLFSTVLGINTYVSSFIDTTELTSTLVGLGTFGYFSTIGIYSTVTGLYNFIQADIGSTIVGLGTAGYFSTIGFDSKMASTVNGLGTAGYASTIAVQQLSNYTRNILQDFSTGLSTVALFTSNTSNFSRNILQDFSTGLSTVALFTSNTSNFSRNILQDFSTGLSTVALFTSNTSNFSRNILQDFSTGLSTVALFTSNTSNFSRNILQDFSTPILSTVIGLGTAGYASTSYVTTQISSFSTSLGQIGSGNLTTANLTSTVVGLGTLGYISSPQLLSTVVGLNTYISSFIDTTELTSTLIGLGTFGYFSTIGIYSTVTGLYNFIQDDIGSTIVGLGTAGFISTIGLEARLTSTTRGLGTAGYASVSYVTAQISSFSTSLGAINSGNLTSTVIGLGTAGYISSSQLRSTVSGIYTSIQQTQIAPSDYVAQGRLSGDLSIPTNTTTIPFVDDFDPQNWYNSTTYRFQPTIQGYYSVSLAAWLSGVGTAPTNQYNIQILSQTGATYAISQQTQTSTFGLSLEATKIIFFNGSTDYIYFTVFNGTNVNQTLLAGTSPGSGTWFSAFLIASGASSGWITSTNLTSTVIGLGTAGYASTSYVTQQISSFSTSLGQIGSGNLTTANLASTVVGLGTIGYISSSQLTSTVSGIYVRMQQPQLGPTDFIAQGRLSGDVTLPTGTTTVPFIDQYDPQNWFNTSTYRFQPTIAGYYSVSFAVWLSSVASGAGQYNIQILDSAGGSIALSQQPQGSVSGVSLEITKIIYFNGTTDFITFTVYNGNAANQTLFYGNNIGSGTWFSAFLIASGASAGLVTSTSLISTVAGLGTAGYASTSYVLQQISSFSTSLGQIGSGNLTTANLASTVTGLGTVGYISSQQLQSTVQGIANFTSTTYIDTPELTSSLIGLGTLTYISAPTLTVLLVSTTQGLGTIGYISSQQLQSTTIGFTRILNSSIIGLGTAGYASTSYVTSQISSFSTAIATAISQGGISQTNLTSSLIGLGTFGFISSPQLISTVVGIGNIYISTGGGGGISPTQLISTTVGLGNIYISTAGGGSGDVTSQQLQSTTRGLGTALYASTKLVFICTQGEVLPFPPINFPTVLNQDWSTPVSTVALFTSNTSNFYFNSYINNYSTPLFSTVIGLGTANYASTSLVYIPNVSTQAVLPFPAIGVFPLSTVSAAYATFSSLTSETSYIGLTSSLNAIRFYGLEGTYDRTVIAERTISEATQELILFKGSTTTENIRLQTTGSILLETGVSSRSFDTATQVSTPTVTITNTNQVGINCNSPSFTLDISGSLNVSGPFSSRLRVVASTITTSQTITVNDIGAFFFYTTSTPLISINMPTPTEAGNGWNVTIQNTPASVQVLTVQTTPPVVLSQSVTRRFITDGNSWYFI